MKVSFLGGAYEVGASCILTKIDDKNILMDSGIRQGAAKDPLPDFRTVQENGGVDAIIISHAHLDHIGSLPMISKEYPNARIYMNNMTKDLLRVLLYDSLKIMNNREGEIPLYAEVDVENMLNRIFTINYEVEFQIFEGISITFYNAGHIAGASCVYLKGSEGALFYSGDFSVFSQKTVEGAKVPKLRPDVGIFECTYADKLHSNREIEEDRLISIVSECIEKKGKMIIPAFALGRAQEVILILKKAMNSKKIKKVNVYIDGMVKDINRVYKLNPLYLRNMLGKKILRGIEPFYDDNIKQITNKEEREKILEDNDACIIIASSGMITGGPSQLYAEKIAPMENGYIVITGYQDEESPGRKLLNLLEAEEKDRILEINNRSIPVKCRVERVGLSAHADKSEINGLISKLTPKNIFLVHGNSEVIDSFSSEICHEVRGRVYSPKPGETFDINIRNPRKQYKKEFKFYLNQEEVLSEENVEVLWKFIYENYNEKLVTIEELMFLWQGKSRYKVSEIEEFKNIILKTPYFESDLRRLFLFKARNAQEVEEELRPKELKPNEINDLTVDYFKEFEYKKASFKMDEKMVILNFDFPQAVDQSILEIMKLFEEKFTWKVEVNSQLNNNAADNLIKRLLKEVDIKKISHHLNENRIVVVLNSNYNDSGECNEFEKITGVKLQIQGNDNANIMNELGDEEKFIVCTNANVFEQNKALQTIDEYFKDEEFKPYKKGIKSNHLGKFIELTFISPIIGSRYIEKIKKLSYKIGWSLSISDSVNQNAIINLAVQLCDEYGIKLKKTPSFNSALLKVSLKAENVEEESFSKIKDIFEFKTGCSIEV